eukprot:gene11725-15692_t
MAEITAALVKDLREKTGVGMMDCKKALTENNGDIEASIDWLRAKGLSKAAKKADRAAAEGLVGVYVEGNTGVLVELNAETDFVSRNEQFQAAVSGITKLAHGFDGLEALGAAASPAGEGTVNDYVTNLIATIGENMTLRRMAKVSVNQGVVASYIHTATGEGLGRIGVLVGVETGGDAAVANDIGRKVAMHIAATAPLSLKTDDLDPAVVERERQVLTEQARESGKSDDVIARMIEGRIRKFYEEVVLLQQPFVMNPDQTVAAFVAETAKAAGISAEVTGFAMFKLGDGVEKKEDDFAAEVAALSGLSKAGRRSQMNEVANPKDQKPRRILLKISGEALMGDGQFGIDQETCLGFARDVKAARDSGIELCLVIGGGNIFRGISGAAKGMERATADYMGMLATVINALALQGALESIGVHTRVQSAIPMQTVCEPYIRRRAMRHMEKGRIVIFAAGVGSPFFTTDSGAALRAAEMGCDALLKGTGVDGVYTADPKTDPTATRYDKLSYTDVLAKNLKVMDASAVSMMRDSNIPIIVFNIRQPGRLAEVLAGTGVCTVITDN